MYAPIFPSWYIKKEMWHRVNPHDPRRAACSFRAILDHEKTRADLPENAAYCLNCARREPYGKPNAETVAAFKEIEGGGGEVFHGTAEEVLEKILNEDNPPETLNHSP